MNHKLVTALLPTLVAAVPFSAIAAQAPDQTQRLRSPRVIRFDCDRARVLTVTALRDIASVKFGPRIYQLKRKEFAMGDRFTSPEATLIIDGDFAVFVTRDSSRPEKCLTHSESQARL